MKPRYFSPVIWMFFLAAVVAAGARAQYGPMPAQAAVIRVDREAQAGKLVRWVMPVYPPEAKKARIQGKVVLKALIGTDGRVERLEYSSGPPILAKAAMDAVRQWKYNSTWVNGGRMKVETAITVIFSLGQPGEANPEFPTLPAQPPPPRSGKPGVTHRDGQAQAGKLVHRVVPLYPPEAKREGVEGIVVLRAVIGEDGQVLELTYVSGPMILVRSAMDAVRQWRYAPTLVNGKPVRVETTITVRFSLDRGHRSA